MSWVFLLVLQICAAQSVYWWPYEIEELATKDNTLYFADDPSHQLSNGQGGSVVVGRASEKTAPLIRRALVFFNLTTLFKRAFGVSDGIDVYDASIQMTVKKTGLQDIIVDMYQLDQDFGEGSSNAGEAPNSGAPAQENDATWLFARYPFKRWKSAGGDYDSDTLLASQNVTTFGTYEWTGDSLLTQLINLYQNPMDNHGFLFKAKDETQLGTKEFYGHQVASEFAKPKVILKYYGPPPVWFWYTVGLVGAVILIVVSMVGLYHCQKGSCSRDSTIHHYTTIRDFSVLTANTSLEDLFNDPAIRVFEMSEISMGRVIGTGAFGAVFEGTLANGSKVAVKKVSMEVAEEEADLFAFADEIKIMSAIAHPNLLALIGISFSADFTDVVLITELIENGSLSDNLFKKHKKFEPNKKLLVLKEIAFGIHYLHSIRPRIIHRDLKSDNILMTRTYSVKIADFGMSKMIQEQSKILTRSGTPHYMAPECIAEGKFSEKSDVYAFGIVAWEVYSETRPYVGVGSPFQIMYKVVHEGLRPVLPAGTPEIYQYLIGGTTQFDPSTRPSFKEILLKLDLGLQSKGKAEAHKSEDEGLPNIVIN